MTNYRGCISLLSNAAKAYNIILFNRIRRHVDPVLRKHEGGFRPGRSCAQQIHKLRTIIEGVKEYQIPLTVTFVDFKKAFDFIKRTAILVVVLRHYGIPKTIPQNYTQCHTSSSQQFQQCCNGGWKHLRSLWCYIKESFKAIFWYPSSLSFFIVLVDYLLSKPSGPDSGVVTCPRKSTGLC